jgi:hypothetical protein
MYENHYQVRKESIISDGAITFGTSEKTELDDKLKTLCNRKLEFGTAADDGVPNLDSISVKTMQSPEETVSIATPGVADDKEF